MSGLHERVVVAASVLVVVAAVTGAVGATAGPAADASSAASPDVVPAETADQDQAGGGNTTGTDTGRERAANASDETVRVTDLDPVIEPAGPKTPVLEREASEHGTVEVVVVATHPGAVTDDRLATVGATVTTRDGAFLQLEATAEQVRALKNAPWVETVRRPATPVVEATSEGVQSVNATSAHALGETGAGVTVGVIDTGFDETQPDISGQVVESRGFGASESRPHGTAVAEFVAETAPDSQLYLAAVASEGDYREAVDWLDGEDVDVIVMSMSWTGGPGDGTSDVALKAQGAIENGSVWVNSAGNYAGDHWEDTFADSDGDGWHDFASTPQGPDEVNELNGGDAIKKGQPVHIEVEWDDWPSSDNDYDVYLVDSERTRVAKSEDIQNGGQFTGTPTETIKHTVQSTGVYGIAIRNAGAADSPKIEAFGFREGSFEYTVPEGSMLAPADNPKTIAVGAYNYQTEAVEYFSSSGPTDDGRTGVTVAGPDGTTSDVYGGPFYGTSAAAPHVGGVAAILVGSDGSLAPADVRDRLTSTAVDINETGVDYRSGYGKVDAVRALRADSTATEYRLDVTVTGGFAGTSVGADGKAASVPKTGSVSMRVAVESRPDGSNDAWTAADGVTVDLATTVGSVAALGDTTVTTDASGQASTVVTGTAAGTTNLSASVTNGEGTTYGTTGGEQAAVEVFEYGFVKGAVTNTSGDALGAGRADVGLFVYDESSGAFVDTGRATQTDSRGEFEFGYVRAGNTYRVAASTDSGAVGSSENVSLAAGETKTADVVLAVEAEANPFPNGVDGTGASTPPADPNGDGLYEDVDGNGAVGFDDVIGLAFAVGSAGTMDQAQTDALDFDGNGTFDFGDVISLAFGL
jgi:hypothetical protein